jgi:hypothetical protein
VGAALRAAIGCFASGREIAAGDSGSHIFIKRRAAAQMKNSLGLLPTQKDNAAKVGKTQQ